MTAPQDEQFTPYVDENKKAVKFNVMIRYKGRDVWLYKKSGTSRRNVIELANGESDRNMFLKYLEGEAEEACIKFSDRYHPKDRYEREDIREICTSIITRTKGRVELGDSDVYASSKVSSGEVQAADVW